MSLVGAVRQHPLYSKYLFQIRQRVFEWVWTRHGKPPYLPAPHTVKQRTIRALSREFSLRTLVETGTYLGNMVHALRKDFGRIVSIELDAALHERAQRLFAGATHVSIVHGDSAQVMPRILESLTEPALFWLDGHYAGPGTSKASTESPILEELRAIASSPLDHVILIDDARLFLLGHEDYPSLRDLQERIRAAWPRYRMRLEDDIIRVFRAPREPIEQPVRVSVLVDAEARWLRLERGDAARITFEVEPGTRLREPSRWWVWASTPEGERWFTRRGWVSSPQPLSIGRFLLFELAPIQLWGRKRRFEVPGMYFFGLVVTTDAAEPAEVIATGHACVVVGGKGRGEQSHGEQQRATEEFRSRLARHFPARIEPSAG